MFYIVLLDFPFLFPFYIYYIIFFAVCQVVILHKLFCWFLWNFTKTCPIKFFSFPSTLHIYYTLFFQKLQGANCTNFFHLKKFFCYSCENAQFREKNVENFCIFCLLTFCEGCGIMEDSGWRERQPTNENIFIFIY